jgi:DNA-binding transcriptional regulator YiaG
MATAALKLASDPLPTTTSAASVPSGIPASPAPWNNKVLIAILGMMIGTGGVANAALVNREPATSSQFYVTVCDDDTANGNLERALMPQEQIAGIQRYLSMNVKDLSATLRVARPTVYAWMRGVEPHGSNLKRISQVYRLARAWRAMSSIPLGQYLSVRLPAGGSVLEQFAEEELDEVAIIETFAKVKSALDSGPRRLSVIEAARARGLRAVDTHATGKWSSDDDLNL